jgi:pyruvate dehydrogenase E1 component alpha subunit
MKELIAKCREGNGPCAVEFETTRFYGHFEGDPQNYRGPDEVKNDRENNDCVKIFRSKVTEAGLLSDEDLDKIDSEVINLIETSAEEAAAAPVPSPEEVTTDVYVSY